MTGKSRVTSAKRPNVTKLVTAVVALMAAVSAVYLKTESVVVTLIAAGLGLALIVVYGTPTLRHRGRP